jgi:Co/Zn/Cd efflux system component
LAVVSASVEAKAKVAIVKACLIAGGALAVAAQIAWRFANPAVPVFETMGVAAFLNLGANLLCLSLLTPYRHADVNMASVWECWRNDVLEGCAVIAAALGVWIFKAGWPDLAIAVALLLLFARSARRVMRNAARHLRETQRAVA